MNEGGSGTATDEPTSPADDRRCVGCGAPITQTDGFCAACGAPTPTNTTRSPSTVPDRPESTRTTSALTGQWWIGVATSLGAWWLLIIVAGPGQPGLDVGYLGASGTALQLINVIVWVMMPVAGYLDIQHVRENSNWDPSTPVWLLAMTVWLINLIAAAAYLYRRHEALGVP